MIHAPMLGALSGMLSSDRKHQVSSDREQNQAMIDVYTGKRVLSILSWPSLLFVPDLYGVV